MCDKEVCKNCRFSGKALSRSIRTCDYLLRTGKKRPCESGKNCTVFEKRTPEDDKQIRKMLTEGAWFSLKNRDEETKIERQLYDDSDIVERYTVEYKADKED